MCICCLQSSNLRRERTVNDALPPSTLLGHFFDFGENGLCSLPQRWM